MRVIFSSLGLIFGLSGVVIGIVITLNPKPFISPYLGPLLCLGSTIMLVYAIWSLYLWSKNQQEVLKNQILSDTSQLIAHWHYQANQWRNFAKEELKKSRRAVFLGLWMFSGILLLGVVLVMYFQAGLQWGILQYVLLGFVIVMMASYYLVARFQNRKQQTFLEPAQPEIHLSLHGLLINKKWATPFKKSSHTLVGVDKVNVHQQVSLCFTIRISTGEGDSLRKHHVPIPQNEMEHLPQVLEAFQQSIAIKK